MRFREKIQALPRQRYLRQLALELATKLTTLRLQGLAWSRTRGRRRGRTLFRFDQTAQQDLQRQRSFPWQFLYFSPEPQ